MHNMKPHDAKGKNLSNQIVGSYTRHGKQGKDVPKSIVSSYTRNARKGKGKKSQKKSPKFLGY